MLIGVRMVGFLNISNQAQASKLKDALMPFAQYFVNVREGEGILEEISFIQIEKHYHDEDPPKPCETILLWKKGEGIVIDNR